MFPSKFLKILNCNFLVHQYFTSDCFHKLPDISLGGKKVFLQLCLEQKKMYNIKGLDPHSWGQDNSEELKPLRGQLAVIYGGDTFMTMELFATYFTTGQIPLLSSL